jgi:hypothetical protein
VWLVVVALGVAVGVATSLGQAHLNPPFLALVNSASPWLVAPFVVGALSRRVGTAAVAGGAVCVLQLAAYYVTAHARGYPAGTAIVVFWLVCGVVGGPLFGAAGLLWRGAPERLRGLGGTALGAVFLAEGLWVYWHTLHYESTVVLWLSIAVLMLALLARRAVELRWLPLTFAAALIGEFVLSAAYSQSFG